MKVIDATDSVMGRLAMATASYALDGEQVYVVNAEKSVITGNRKTTLKQYLEKRELGTRYNGPFFPKKPDRILKRAVRGMVPYRKERGKLALKNIKIFTGIPEEFKNTKLEVIENAKVSSLLESRKITTLEELSKGI